MIDVEVALRNPRRMRKLIRDLTRQMGPESRMVRSGLLEAARGAEQQVRARVPRGRTGRLRRSVRTRIMVGGSSGQAGISVGYRTLHPGKLERTGEQLPRHLQAVVSEWGSIHMDSFTGKALRTVAINKVFPDANRRYIKGFLASYQDKLKAGVTANGLRLTV